MTAKLKELTAIEVAVYPRDIGTANITSSYVSMAGKRRVRAKLVTGLLASAATATLLFKQAKGVGGTSPKDLGTVQTFTSPANNTVGELDVEISPEDLDHANGYDSIAVEVGCSTNGVLGSCILEIDNAYKPEE